MFRFRPLWIALLSLQLVGAAMTHTTDVRSEAIGSIETALSGSRLLPLYLAGEDGSRQFAGWFDTARGERCAYAIGGDGAMRCLPADDTVQAELYADAGCTRAIASLPACPIPKYLITVESVECSPGARRHVHKLGAKMVPAIVYARSASGCARREPGGAPYVAVGPEISPVSFSAAAYTAGRGGLMIKTQYETH
jgi:hypothetical protein